MTNKPLLVVGCMHIGQSASDYPLIHRYIDWAKKSKAFILLLGDLFEAALPHKGSMMFEQTMNPQDQYDAAVKLLAPVAHQVIGACTSNHSARAYNVAGIDLDKMLADKLGYLHVYGAHQNMRRVKVGSQTYNIAFTHGAANAGRVFGDCFKLHGNYPTADICCSSHSHCLATMKDAFLEEGPKGRTIHPVTYIVAGAALGYAKYADAACYPPKPKGFAIAWLSPKEKQVIVDVSGTL